MRNGQAAKTKIHRWLDGDRLPGDLYELLGRPRFDPDREALLEAVRAAYGALLPYQNHSDPKVARRAMEIQRELGRAEDVLSHPEKLRAHHEKILEDLAQLYKRLRESGRDWSPARTNDWLRRQQSVDPRAVERVAEAIRGARDETLDSGLLNTREISPLAPQGTPADAPEAKPRVERPARQPVFSRPPPLPVTPRPVVRSIPPRPAPAAAEPLESIVDLPDVLTAPPWENPAAREARRYLARKRTQRFLLWLLAGLLVPTVGLSLWIAGRYLSAHPAEKVTRASPGDARPGQSSTSAEALSGSPQTGEAPSAAESVPSSQAIRPTAPKPRKPTAEVRRKLAGRGASVTCLAFDPRGSMLATGATSGGVTLWNVADGAIRQTFRQGRGWVRGLAFSKDGSSVTWVLSSGSVFTADVATGQTGESPQNSSRGRSPRALALAPDGSMLAVAIDPSAVELREATTGQLRRTLHGSGNLALELAFSADGSTLAAARSSQDVDVWDVATGESRQGPPRSPRRPASPNERLALSPDGRRLAWLDRDWTLAVWDEKTEQVRHVPLGRSRGKSSSGAGTPLAFCPDGSTLVLGTRSLEFCNPLLGEVWPVSDRSTVPIASLAVSPDGSLVATGHADGSTTLWDVTWSDLPDADDAEPDEHEIPPEPPAASVPKPSEPSDAEPDDEETSPEPADPFAPEPKPDRS